MPLALRPLPQSLVPELRAGVARAPESEALDLTLCRPLIEQLSAICGRHVELVAPDNTRWWPRSPLAGVAGQAAFAGVRVLGRLVTVVFEGKVAVVAVEGDVDAASAPELKAELETLLSGGRQDFAIDMAEVRFMDSAGIATLVQLFKRVRTSGETSGSPRCSRPSRRSSVSCAWIAS